MLVADDPLEFCGLSSCTESPSICARHAPGAERHIPPLRMHGAGKLRPGCPWRRHAPFHQGRSRAAGRRHPAPKQAPAKMALVLPPPRPQPPRAAIPKRADAPPCASNSECMVRLKAMIDDPSRGWIGKPQSAAEYANGTRLFAYRALHSQLTCPQLTTALNEVAACGQHLPWAGARCHRRAGQARPGAQHRRRAGTAGGNRWPVQGLIRPGSSRSVQLCACDADHGAGRDRPAARFATACPAGSPPVRAQRTHRP